ncbi:probable low affinity copper uptake protein 2 [Pecten maximus]|uniref:probable low affinity copper uptake protein 2 n=1 Tax=Pecten maximus TaxID=6579 RepID=UPI001458D1AF|nr:probable low affinity copper uptake protein 2 [Pecten maximus]
MKDHFNFEGSLKNFFFKGLDVESTSALVVTCLVVGAMTFLLEGAKMLMLYWSARIAQNPLTYGFTDTEDLDDRDDLTASLMIPSSLEQIRSRRIKYHCLGMLTHTFNLLTGYIIMLAVMTYNVWITIGVIAGSGVGFFIFGGLRSNMQTKYEGLKSSIENTSNFQINLVVPEEQHI